MEAMKSARPVSTDIIAVSREMVPLNRINISDEQLAWAEKIMKKVEKEGMPPIQTRWIARCLLCQAMDRNAQDTGCY